MNSVAYCETTAVLDAVFKKYPNLKELLASYSTQVTAQYAKMEIKRGFLHNLVLLHNKIVLCERWSDVQQYISNLSSSPRRYQLGTILDALTRFWKAVEDRRPSELAKKHGDIPHSQILKRDTLSFLRLWIRSLLVSIDKFFDEIMNPMNCFPDLEKPVRKGDLFENKPCRCNESQRECDIKDFFLRNQIEFTKILEKLKGLQETEVDNETRQRISALKKIMKKRLRTSTTHFSNKTQDEQMCWACGDAIHAVLAPREAGVITRNEKHFRPICEAIGRSFQAYGSPKAVNL